ncbi:hypothetical protein [Coleofasciculus sp. FACHB-1120]|uniref:hypothetical protein n=1 Tax=Coleofasciculus sp. FACHB-1120 TaxID=2692783 RepID=UPI0016873296|nr:hypothetical protein [Coleofasciculus sp. FACHB-1120]MBD2740781.1 hypothetical protein [Coleofasciculus sp. FACHB-1120]
MLKKVSLLAASLMLAACSAIAVSNHLPVSTLNDLTSSRPDPASRETQSFPPVAALPEPQCQGEIPPSLKASLSEYRLAQESDFVASIRAYERENPGQRTTCSIFTADFNEDRQKDYALLLVNPKNNNFRFFIAINQRNGQFNPAVVKDFSHLPESSEGIIYTAISFKPPGELGPAAREYSPLKYGTSEQQIFKAKPAIELWKALPTDSAGVAQYLEIGTLAYCSNAFYFVDGKLKTFGVCD